jgi:hypothetical protein
MKYDIKLGINQRKKKRKLNMKYICIKIYQKYSERILMEFEERESKMIRMSKCF